MASVDAAFVLGTCQTGFGDTVPLSKEGKELVIVFATASIVWIAVMLVVIQVECGCQSPHPCVHDVVRLRAGASGHE